MVWRQQALAIPSNISPIDGIEMKRLLMSLDEESFQNAWNGNAEVPNVGQRDDVFKGGIQFGGSAHSDESVGTERLVRDAVQSIQIGDEVSWTSGVSGGELSDLLGVKIEESESSLAGAYPDGGIFWHAGHPGKVLCVAEAKKQGENGNAIERWFKNYSIMRRLGCEIYLTVCTGDGFFNGKSAQKTLETAVATDPFDFYRIRQDAVWNQQEGSIWLYRFRDADQAASFDLTSLMQDAIAESLRRTKYREARRP